MDYIFNVLGLEMDTQVDSANLLSIIFDQIQGYGKTDPDHNRYKVYVEFFQGRQAPAKNLDDYIGSIIESITHSNLFWFEREQVDEIMIKKVKNPRLEKSKLRIQIRTG